MPPPSSKSAPELNNFLSRRDFIGAATLLRSRLHSKSRTLETSLWLAYSLFHNCDYSDALHIYERLLLEDDADPMLHIYSAVCLFHLGEYARAEEAALRGADCELKTRILFHCAHRQGNEDGIATYHQRLTDSIEDQLSLASMHYLRGHFQEATDIYKRHLLEHRDFLALNVYIALCYTKLDYYDVSLEILAVYLQAFADSIIAVNLKACNSFRLYNGEQAEKELQPLKDPATGELIEHDLIKHNLVVFRNGEKALQVLPNVKLSATDARLNLAIYHIRKGDINASFDLLKELEPKGPQEYILKGVVHACLGQQGGSSDNLRMAQQFFQLVGASASECDTIPGRQCMASCFFLLQQFDDVLIYLKSIKQYFYSDDDFNWNYGIALAAVGDYKEAEPVLTAVRNENYRMKTTYVCWLARCYIMNGKPRSAWDLYLRLEKSVQAFSLLQTIANDCYKESAFLYAAKAFDVLERADGRPEYWQGKRGACVGAFRQVVAGLEYQDSLRDIIAILRSNFNPQVEDITRVIKDWAITNGASL